MQQKFALFFLFLATQIVVFCFFYFDGVDKLGVVVNYSRQRWKSSSNFYEFAFPARDKKAHSDQPGFISSVGDTLSDAKESISEWFSSKISGGLAIISPPSYLTNGDVKDKAFAPKVTEQVFLLILITSHPKSSSRRLLIRKTWAGTFTSKRSTGKAAKSTNTGSSSKNIYCVFTVGFTNDHHMDHHIENEHYLYGDIIRVDSKEQYSTLVNKIWGSFGWAISVRPKYVLKADDDVYVHVPNFRVWLQDSKLPKRLYAGFVHYRAFVYRNHGSKWFVSRAEYPHRTYPEYCAGPFYVFSGYLLTKLYQNSQKFKKFQVEDAYFGVVAKSIGLKPFHAGKAFLLDNNLHSTVTGIPNSRLKELCVMGHGLMEEEIRYIHNRYQSIKES